MRRVGPQYLSALLTLQAGGFTPFFIILNHLIRIFAPLPIAHKTRGFCRTPIHSSTCVESALQYYHQALFSATSRRFDTTCDHAAPSWLPQVGPLDIKLFCSAKAARSLILAESFCSLCFRSHLECNRPGLSSFPIFEIFANRTSSLDI